MPLKKEFDPYIGTRQSTVDPAVTEYYRKDNNTGFSNESQLFQYANSLGRGSVSSFNDLNGTPPSSVNPSNPVPAGDLTKAPVTYPPGQSMSDPSAFVSSIAEYEKIARASSTPALSAAEKEQATLTQDLKTATDQLATRGSRLQEEENKLGVTADTQKLQELNTMIAQRTSEFNKAYTDEEGRPIPIQFITGRQAFLRRQQAVEIGALEARRAALQGNLELSKQIAQRTVDLEFEPLEQKIKNAQLFLQLNNDNLSREEKKQAERIAYVTQQQEKDLQERKEARAFALENGVTTPYFNRSGTIYRTSDGKAFSTPEEFRAATGIQDLASVPSINPLSSEDRGYVSSLATKYPDAGIRLSDSPETAQAKLKSSRIYQEQIRPPSNGTNGSTITEPGDLAALGQLQGIVNDLNIGGKDYNSIPDALKTFIAASYDTNPLSPNFGKITYKMNEPSAKQLKALSKELGTTTSKAGMTEQQLRTEYDKDLQEIEANKDQFKANKQVLYEEMVKQYGTKISKEEIEATLNNILK